MIIDYASGKTPADYICHECGATGVKLWRQYQAVCPRLLCAQCAAAGQDHDISTMDAYGRRIERKGQRGDQIGWYVPAVPDEEGVGYWGYTSVPDAGVKWWRALPNQLEETP